MCLNLPCPDPVTRATLLSKDCNCWYGNLWTLSFFKLNSLNGELMKVLLDVTNLFQLVKSKYFSFASNAYLITNFTCMVLDFGVRLLSVYHGRNRLFNINLTFKISYYQPLNLKFHFRKLHWMLRTFGSEFKSAEKLLRMLVRMKTYLKSKESKHSLDFNNEREICGSAV